mmetsp:Transcript_37001/g.118612  ORF Transcript_37001/g.118612 Transcript_37001/m.118612 type:complete len:314 (+) Transcript_37001:312-1253(+)
MRRLGNQATRPTAGRRERCGSGGESHVVRVGLRLGRRAPRPLRPQSLSSGRRRISRRPPPSRRHRQHKGRRRRTGRRRRRLGLLLLLGVVVTRSRDAAGSRKRRAAPAWVRRQGVVLLRGAVVLPRGLRGVAASGRRPRTASGVGLRRPPANEALQGRRRPPKATPRCFAGGGGGARRSVRDVEPGPSLGAERSRGRKLPVVLGVVVEPRQRRPRRPGRQRSAATGDRAHLPTAGVVLWPQTDGHLESSQDEDNELSRANAQDDDANAQDEASERASTPRGGGEVRSAGSGIAAEAKVGDVRSAAFDAAVAAV